MSVRQQVQIISKHKHSNKQRLFSPRRRYQITSASGKLCFLCYKLMHGDTHQLQILTVLLLRVYRRDLNFVFGSLKPCDILLSSPISLSLSCVSKPW